MPKYMEVAAEANKTAEELLTLIIKTAQDTPCSDAEMKPLMGHASCLIARLINYGIRCSPRGVQSTVRINAVQRATQSLPVKCYLIEKDGYNGRTYKALVTEPKE